MEKVNVLENIGEGGNMLSGYKTYIIMSLIFVVGGLKGLGYIDDSHYNLIVSLLTPAGIMALRAAINK